MRKFIAGTVALAVISAAVIAVMASGSALATQNGGGHIAVSLCHRTGSVDGGNQHNGYDLITVDLSSIAGIHQFNGHDGHNQVGNGPGGDIIPAASYTVLNGPDKGTVVNYAGKNLDTVFANGETGAEVLAAGCAFSQPEQPTVVEPVDPVVTQPTCDSAGNVAVPENSAGVSYNFDQETLVLTATANEGFVIGSDAPGWNVAEGGASATFQVVVDAPPTNCGGGGNPPPPPPPPPGGGSGNPTPPPVTGGGVTVTRQAVTL